MLRGHWHDLMGRWFGKIHTKWPQKCHFWNSGKKMVSKKIKKSASSNFWMRDLAIFGRRKTTRQGPETWSQRFKIANISHDDLHDFYYPRTAQNRPIHPHQPPLKNIPPKNRLSRSGDPVQNRRRVHFNKGKTLVGDIWEPVSGKGVPPGSGDPVQNRRRVHFNKEKALVGDIWNPFFLVE